MAVTIGEIQVETAAPAAPAATGSSNGAGGGAAGGGSPEELKKELDKILWRRESRVHRLWAY